MKQRPGRTLDSDRVEHPRAAGRDVVLPAILTVVVLATVFFAFRPVLSCKALSFDDQQYLTENFVVQHPSWASAKRFLGEIARPSTVAGYYQPLTMISLLLDYAVAGRADSLRTFHRTSLVLHLANTALVMVLLYVLFDSARRAAPATNTDGSVVVAPAVRRSTGATWAAAIGGLLFGLHPLAIEPVAWVGERKTVLDAFFALGCLILYVVYTRRSSRGLYAACVGAYVLALLSKPTSTPLPVLMLLLDFWPLRRLSRRSVVEKIPLFVIGAISAAITIISQGNTATVKMPGAYAPLHIPLILSHNIVFYLYKIVWPANLSWFYPFPQALSLGDEMVLAGVIGTCLLVPGLLLSLRWSRAPITSWLFFFVAIFPTMGVIGFTAVIAADRFAYLPSVGLLMGLAWLIGWAWDRGAGTSSVNWWRAGLLAGVLVIASLEVVATHGDLRYWQDSRTLFERMVSRAPNSPFPHNGLALAYVAEGRLDDAVREYREVLRLKQDYPQAQNDLGGVLVRLGRPDEALPHFVEAVRLDPNLAQAQANLGKVLADQGRFDEAVAHLTTALQLRPDSPVAHYNMGLALMGRRGRLEEAVRHFREAIRLKPDHAGAHESLGNALADLNRPDEAVSEYREALRLAPGNYGTWNNLGLVLASQGKVDEGVAAMIEAVRLNPRYAKAHSNLASMLLRRRRIGEAISHCHEALSVEPDLLAAQVTLGNALRCQGKTDEAIAAFREAVRTHPRDPTAHFVLGAALDDLGKLSEAVEEYRLVLQFDPRNAGAQQRLAAALAKQKG